MTNSIPESFASGGVSSGRAPKKTSGQTSTGDHLDGNDYCCPHCNFQYSPFPQIVASVVGRPTAGKSEWIAAAIFMCQNYRLPKLIDLWVRPTHRWTKRVELYEGRQRPPRDPFNDSFLTPTTFHGTRRGFLFRLFKHRFAVSVCDSSGEHFSVSDRIFSSKVRDTLLTKSSHVLVVDPTYEPAPRKPEATKSSHVEDKENESESEKSLCLTSNPSRDIQAFLTQLDEYLASQLLPKSTRLGFVMTKLDQVLRAAKGTPAEKAAQEFEDTLREIDTQHKYDAFARGGHTFNINQKLLHSRSDATIEFLQSVWTTWDLWALQARIQEKCGPNAGWWFPTTTVSFDVADMDKSYDKVTEPHPYGVLEPLVYLAWIAGHVSLPVE